MTGIDHVTLTNNVIELDTASPTRYGGVTIVTAESSPAAYVDVPIANLYAYGNRNVGGEPILSTSPLRSLADNLEQWGSKQTLANGNGTPIGGKIEFASESDRLQGIITGTGTNFLSELQVGDLLSTNSSGGLGRADGPFYVQTVASQTQAILSRAGHPEDVIVGASLRFAVKRYRGQVGYLTASGSPVANGTASGLAGIAGKPADFDFDELFVSGRATFGSEVSAQSFSGPMGATAESTGKFTTLEGTGDVFLHPTGANVMLAPIEGNVILTPGNGDVTICTAAGGPTPSGGKTTINCSVTGTMDNIDIGTTRPRPGTFTVGTFSSVNSTGSVVATYIYSSGTIVAVGAIAGALFSGSGAGLTQLGAANLTGDIAIARMANALTAPGPIGGGTPNTGTFTTLTANSPLTANGTLTANAVTSLSPANANVTISPTGTGTVTINPASVGSINKMSIGATAAGTGAFTTLSASGAVTLSPGGGNSVTISPAGGVAISPTGGSVTISPTNGGVTIAPGGGNAVTITPAGTLTLGGAGSSATTIASGSPGTINNMHIGYTNRQTGTFTQVATYDGSMGNTSITDFRRAYLLWSGGDFFIETSAMGSGLAGFNHLNLRTAPGKQIRFWGGSGASAVNVWNFDGSGHLVAATDNTYDIGASGATRPRFVHVARTTVSGVASPAQITANQNNYNPGAQGKYLRLWTDASRNITGLTFTTAQVDGEEHLIVNVGSFDIVLNDESTSTASAAANRFNTTTGADVTLTPKQQAMCWYDGATGRWRVSKLN